MLCLKKIDLNRYHSTRSPGGPTIDSLTFFVSFSKIKNFIPFFYPKNLQSWKLVFYSLCVASCNAPPIGPFSRLSPNRVAPIQRFWVVFCFSSDVKFGFFLYYFLRYFLYLMNECVTIFLFMPPYKKNI